MENHPLHKYVYLIIQCTKTTFLYNILINYRDIKPKRDKYVIFLKRCDVTSSSGNTFIPSLYWRMMVMFILFFGNNKQEMAMQIYSLSLL